MALLDEVNTIAEDQCKNRRQFLTHGSNYAMVLKSLLQNFEQETGRVMVFSGSAPRAGALALRVRNEDDNKNPLKPLSSDFLELGKELVKQRVGVDLYFIVKEVLVS
jgi:hypothetical protein